MRGFDALLTIMVLVGAVFFIFAIAGESDMKLGGNGPLLFPLSVLVEDGYIRIVDKDGEWIAVMTGKLDDVDRQLKSARLLVESANRVHRKKKK